MGGERTNLKAGLVMVVLLGFCAIASGKVIYVDAGRPAGGNGQSWGTAYKYLQDGLTAATSGDEIRAAQGTYKPDRGGGKTVGDRTATFQLKNGVAIYGGFPSGGGSRNPNAYKTILSGDLNGNDGPNFANNAENSYNVVTAFLTTEYIDSTAVLDGFTITAGNANGDTDYFPTFTTLVGAGMLNMAGSPTVTNCTFSRNSAVAGGGMVNWGGSPTVTNCTFSDNLAESGSGGGGMGNYAGSPTVTNCTFGNNSAGFGGGMWNGDNSPTVTNCIFIGNSADEGGGMDNRGNSSPTVTNCTFIGNSAKYDGGGMENHQDSSPTVTNCTFSGNLANLNGGGIRNINSSLTLTNGILRGNMDAGGSDESAQIYGGTLMVTYCCIQGLDTLSGGIGNIGDDPMFVRNPDDGGDGWGVGDNDDFGNLRLRAGSPCIDAADGDAAPVKDIMGNPRCDDPGTINTGTGSPAYTDIGAYEWRPQPLIIYVDAGASPSGGGASWDYAFTRLQDALAIASSGDEIWVAQGIYKPDEGIGETPGDRKATFQLIDGVAIYGGFPSGGGAWEDRDPQVYETILSGDLNGDDIAVAEPCDLLSEPTRAENSYQVVIGSNTDSTAVLDGFTITAGNANSADDYYKGLGGGMYNSNGSPTVTNCTFSGNKAYEGGGMYNLNSNPAVTNCTFSGNSAYEGSGMSNYWNSRPAVTNCTFSGNSAIFWVVGGACGGGIGSGMANYESSPTVTNCTFSGNSAGLHAGGMENGINSNPVVTNCAFNGNSAKYGGGGMYNWQRSSPTVANCTFSGNSAHDGGGISNLHYSSPTVTNCTFSGNLANSRGGGIQNESSSNPAVTNCTFSSNSAAWHGGGIGNDGSCSPTLANCILWGNTASSGNEIALYLSSMIDVSYCDVKGGQSGVWVGSDCTLNWGPGNIDADPLFVRNPDDGGDGWGVGDNDDFGNLRLRAGSPCLDVGDNEAVPAGVTTDLDGNRRIVDGDGDLECDTLNVPAGEYSASGPDKLLLHLNGADGAKSTVDSSPQNHAPINFVGNAQLDTAEKKWGSASLLLDGSEDCLTIPDSPDWDILASNTDDWTIDFWVRHDSHSGTEVYLNHNQGGTQRWYITHEHGSGLGFYSGVGVNLGAAGEITDSEWHWIALCKVADKYGMYKDGQQINYVQSSGTGNFTGSLYIGSWSGTGYYFDGHMDELRITHSNIFGASPSEKGISATVDMGAYELWDSDGDGIEEGIDTQPTVYSNDFIDGATSGTITDRGDQILTITDEPDPDGVRIKADSGGGATPATVSVCGGDSIYTLNSGDVAGDDEGIVTCGSVEIEVISGIIEITFVPIDGPAATTSLAAGNSLTFEEDTFTVTAPATNTDIVVLVINGEEFSLAPGESFIFNQPPVAGAGPDQTVYAWIDGIAEATLDGSDSNDPDGDELTYYWSWVIDGNTYEANGVKPTIELPVGEHTIELVVNDGIEDSEPDYVMITVLDNTPPTLTLSVTPSTLWPANHKMVMITPSITVSDNCDDSPEVTLVNITSSEADNAKGDGNTINDIQIINGNIYLRAERSGTGNGRLYNITYQAVDASGNVTTQSAEVTVPHDNGKSKK